MLGDVNVAMGRFDRGADQYARFVALDDRSPRVLYKLALAHYKNRQAAAAIDPLRQAVAMDDRFTEAHHLLGLCFRDRKRNDDALRALRRAVDINPAFTPARADLARLYADLGRSREGIEQLEALAAIEPSRAERLVAVARAYARLGRVDAAIATLGRAADRHPDDPSVFVAIGRVWLDTAEARVDRVALSKALEALQAPASSSAASSDARALYGRALFLSGNTDAGLRALEEAANTLPVDPTVFLWLAAAAERRGDARAARAAAANYANLVPGTRQDAIAQQVADLLRLQQRLRATGARSSPEGKRPSRRVLR
jgi:tetratricopeptide (TPR) repeat protein